MAKSELTQKEFEELKKPIENERRYLFQYDYAEPETKVEFAVCSGDISKFSIEQLRAVPQTFWNHRVAQNSYFISYGRDTSEEVIELIKERLEQVPQKFWNQRVADCVFLVSSDGFYDEYLGIDDELVEVIQEKLEQVPQEYWQYRVASGGFLHAPKAFRKYIQGKLEDVPQEYFDFSIARGVDDIARFPKDKLDNLAADVWNRHVAEGKYLFSYTDYMSEEQLTYIKEKLDAVPQEYWTQRVMDCYYLTVPDSPKNLDFFKDVLEDKLKDVPQEYWNQRVANGDCLEDCPEDKIKNVPNEFWFLRVAKRGYEFSFDELTPEIIKATAPEILHGAYSAQQAVMQFKQGEITSEELPVEVFVNASTRRWLIAIVEARTKEKFNKLCEENGYTDEVPEEIKAAFDETMKNIYDDMDRRMQEGVKEVQQKFEEEQAAKKAEEEAKKAAEEEKMDNTISTIKGLGDW